MPDQPFLILADDLTGSADAALPFWRAGRRAEVVFEPTAAWPSEADVLSVCTHTRAMTETAAQQVLAQLAPRLPANRRLFKKIDSTLRGWIGAECGALLTAQPSLTPVFAPMYPSKGRTMGPDGVYRVHGVPLAETEFASEIAGLDPDSRLPGFLQHHFGPFTPRLQALSAETNEQLRAAAAAIAEPALWIGSPGLAIALAGPASLPHPPAPPPTRLPFAPIVIAAGSRRTLTLRQLAALERSAARGTAAPLRIAEATFEPERALTLADELGRRAASAAARLGRCGMILTGGDIAAAACRHLGITSAEIVGEVEDGLPVLRAGERFLVTKAGGFGDDFSLVRAYDRLARILA